MQAARRQRRIRHHVNPLRSDLLTTAPAPLCLPPGPLEVELGCADARFLFERAPRYPGTQFVGLEIRREWVERVNRKAAGLGLPNLVAVFANINADLEVLFSPGQVDRFFVNFPDPWWKRSQHKRRVMTPELARLLCTLLRPGGELFFQSDVFELALPAMAVLEQTPGLENACGEWSFLRENPYRAQTLREVRVLERGRRVWRMLYVRATSRPGGR
jgi:tRNA (guanine-N7-)-methyltransferase